MKKIFLYTLIFFSLTINAQDKKGKEKIRALKIAYLTEELDLTSSEAEKFWPIYNVYDKKRRELFGYEKNQLNDNNNTIESLTDKEATVVFKNIAKYRNERHENKIAFNNKLLDIIPIKKILKLEVSERAFRKKLMRKLKNK